MRCPQCHLGEDTAILNTRHRADGSVRRRHVCLACNLRWTSSEEICLGSIRRSQPPAALAAAKATQR